MSEADKSPLDPFTQFWADTMSKMGGSGAADAPVIPGMGGAANPFEAMQEEAARQMRRGMLDAWAKSCEEYLGSPQFLEVMKQSMDNALAFRKQVNEFLNQAYEQAQVPSRDDVASLSEALAGFERRIIGRLEDLSRRVAMLEERKGGEVGAAKAEGKS